MAELNILPIAAVLSISVAGLESFNVFYRWNKVLDSNKA